jgi:hypothetical protein
MLLHHEEGILPFFRNFMYHVRGHCVLPIPNYSQQNATFLDLFIFTNTLHVSGGYCAHHQEHVTVHTASGIVNQYRGNTVAASSSIG